MEKENVEKRNWWKWAFISLIIIIFLIFIRLIFLIQPKSVNEYYSDQKEQTDSDEIVLATSIQKNDAEKLMNQFIKQSDEEMSDYSVELTDQLILNGSVDILGLTVPFILSLDPYVLENGDVQFKAQKLDLSSISIPVDIAMSLIVSSLEIPDFISVNTEDKTIIIHFSKMDSAFKINFTKIDLENDLITLNLHMKEYFDSDNEIE